MSKTKLNIYLIKDDVNDNVIINGLNENGGIRSFFIGDNCLVYYRSFNAKQPKWISSFFKNNPNLSGLYGSGVGVVVIKMVIIENEMKKFAIAFGYGHTMINTDSVVENFGFNSAINIINPSLVRSIDKKVLSEGMKINREQLSVGGEISNFGINIEEDLVGSICGKPADKNLNWSNITGKDSFQLAAQFDINTVDELLAKAYALSLSDNYKSAFPWINHIKELKDKSLIINLNNRVLDTIKNGKPRDGSIKMWLSIPDVVDWENVDGFMYDFRDSSQAWDLSFDHFYSLLENNLTREKINQIDLDFLKKIKVFLIDHNNMQTGSWSVYQCLYAEININNEVFILTNKKWYRIESNFSKDIEIFFQHIKKKAITHLPHLKQDVEKEEDYNKRAATEGNFILFDKKNIVYGGKQSKIEFCDFFDPRNKRLIHVKKYGGSSVFSHLFNQGLISAQLFKNESGFRKLVQEEATKMNAKYDFTKRPNNLDYEVIYAITTKRGIDKFDIPFFSKVALKNAVKTLEAYDYKSSLAIIEEN